MNFMWVNSWVIAQMLLSYQQPFLLQRIDHFVFPYVQEVVVPLDGCGLF